MMLTLKLLQTIFFYFNFATYTYDFHSKITSDKNLCEFKCEISLISVHEFFEKKKTILTIFLFDEG